ncbi:MAG: BatD family protein [Pseudomonadales bacterium]
MLFLLSAISANAQDLSARLDRNKVSLDDTFTLIIRSTAMSIFDSPDLSPLEKDFEVLGTNRSSQHSIINGKTQSSLEWHISLAAKREGALVIPPIEIDGNQTPALVVDVSKSTFAKNNAGFEPVFIESEIDTSKVYVQAQTIMTVRIFYAVALERGAQLSELTIENAVVKQLNEAAYETKIKNMNYNVHEVKYAIFPQRSGTLEVPAQTFSALLATRRRSGSLFDNFGGARGNGRPIRATSETHTIEVLPQDARFTGEHWIPAEKISIIENWSKDIDELKAGEPITRSLIVESIGLQGSQVPPLNLKPIEHAQQYPDQPETADEDTALGVIGTRIESLAIIPAGGGELVLPEVKIDWWNTRTNRQETATVPAKTLRVAGTPLAKPEPVQPLAPTNNSSAQPSSSSSSSDPLSSNTAPGAEGNQGHSSFWRTTTWLALALWLGTLAYFAWLRPSRPNVGETIIEPRSKKDALRELEKASQTGNALSIKKSLIEWGREHTGRKNLSALSTIAAHFKDETISRELDALDAALYKNQGEQFSGEPLMAAIRQALASQDEKVVSRGNDLEPLYRA